MWNKNVDYVLNYSKIFGAVHIGNPPTHSLQQNNSGTVAETVKKSVSGLKQKNWTPPLNSPYSN